MRFVVARKTINPKWMGVTVPRDTPGFEHADSLPVGFGFEVTDPEHIQRVKQGQFAVIDDGSQKSSVEVAKIRAEVKAEMERLKNAEDVKRAESTRKSADDNRHKIRVGIAIGLIVAAIIAWITLLAGYLPKWFHS